MLFLQPGLFYLKSLNLFIEFGNQPVLVREFLLCSGKISLAEPCKDGIPTLLRFLYIGLQFGNIRPVADYLLLVIAVLEDSLSTVFRIIKCFLPIPL